MKLKAFVFLACFILIGVAVPVKASADCAPKPSVVIDFDGLDGQDYYVTLLSDVESTGPYSSLEFSMRDNPNNREAKDFYYGTEEDYPAYLKFAEYEDPDGYHFLGYFGRLPTHRFSWGYYPPQNFKILVYFPEKDSFAASEGIYERYAFDTYYRADLTETIQTLGDNTIYYQAFGAERSYNYSLEISSMFIRIAFTIMIEILIALPFAFRQKKQINFILIMNLITQIALNVTLNIIGILHGPLALTLLYILLELLIITIEAVTYTVYLRKHSETEIPKWKPIIYAIVANAASFGIGLMLVNVLPGVF